MSNTVRTNVKFSNYHRRFRNMNFRKSEESAIDELKNEVDVFVIGSFNRLSSWFSRIPNSWDDYPISARSEYSFKKLYKDYNNGS